MNKQFEKYLSQINAAKKKYESTIKSIDDSITKIQTDLKQCQDKMPGAVEADDYAAYRRLTDQIAYDEKRIEMFEQKKIKALDDAMTSLKAKDLVRSIEQSLDTEKAEIRRDVSAVLTALDKNSAQLLDDIEDARNLISQINDLTHERYSIDYSGYHVYSQNMQSAVQRIIDRVNE